MRRQGYRGLEQTSSTSQIILDPLVRAPLVKVVGAFTMSDLKPTNAVCNGTRIMIADIAAWIFTLSIVDPLHTETRRHLDRANVSMQIVQQSRQCLAVEAPRLIYKARSEPGWAIATAISFTTGWMSAQQLFDSADPSCGALIGIIDAENGREAEG